MKLGKLSILWQPAARVCLTGAICVGAIASQSMGQDLQSDTSLKYADEDVAIFSSSMQMDKQWSTFVESSAIQAALKTEFAISAKDKFLTDWNAGEGTFAFVKPQFESAPAQQTIAFLQDLFSKEVFSIVDGAAVDSLGALSKLGIEANQALQTGDEEKIFEWLLSINEAQFAAVKVPTAMIGFRLTDMELAKRQTAQIGDLLSVGLYSIPNAAGFADALDRTDTGRGLRHTITLTGSMIPWKVIRADASEEKQIKVIDMAEQLLSERQLCISIGMLDEYFVIGLSESADDIEALGQDSSLWDSPNFKLVRDSADKDIYNVTYVSDEFAAASFEANFRNYFQKNVPQWLALYQEDNYDEEGEIAEMPAYLATLPEDAAWLDNQMNEIVVTPKGSTGFSYFDETGCSGITHSRTEPILADGSQPLELLSHTGGNPIAMLVGRNSYRPEFFQLSREIVRKAKGYLEAYANSDDVSTNDKREIGVVIDKAFPLLARAADVWETQILPATKDGQFAWVFSQGNLSSVQWVDGMAPSDDPLPLPEFAIATGVSDKDMLIAGFEDLYAIADDAVEAVREQNEDAIPEGYSVPRPEAKQVAGYESFAYALPTELGALSTLAPQAVFADHVAVYGYSNEQAIKLIKESKFGVADWIIDPSADLYAASYIDEGRLIEFLTPWIRYGIVSATGDVNEYIAPPQDGFVGITGKDVLQIWSALTKSGEIGSTTTASENGTMTKWSYRD